MSGLLDSLLEQLPPGAANQLAGSLGVDESAVGKLISAGLPAILGGLANNTQKPEGAAALSAALEKHDTSIFDNLDGLAAGSGDQNSDGNKILGHVLGGRRGAVEQQLASSTGADLSIITKLLPMLAPLVMGYLANQKKSKGLDGAGIGSLLGDERKAQEAKQPGLGGLAAILDANKDGSIMDDVVKMATGAGGPSGASKGKAGLAGLLGKILGR